MTNVKEIRTILGIFGNVVTFLLYISSMPRFVGIYKKKSVEGVRPDIYIWAMMECCIWVLYGLPVVHKDSILISTNFGIAFVITASYVAVFLIYCNDKLRRKDICGCICVGCIIVAAFYAYIFGTLKISPPPARYTPIGVTCSVFSTYMSSCHALYLIKIAMDNSFDFESLRPIWFLLANSINMGIWIFYSLLYKIDLYVLISYGFGALVCFLESIIYACCYYKSNSKTVHH